MLSLGTFRHEIKSLPSTQIFQSSWTVSYKSFSALINATFLWECEHEMKMRQFHNFNFSTVKMSVPWLMKYCPYQINDLDWIFHTSSCIWGLGKPFPQLSLNTTTPHHTDTFHQTYPQFCSPAHFSYFFTSCLGGCLCFVSVSLSLVIGAAADMSLVVIGVSPPRYWVSAASLSHCPQCCGQWRYLVCSGHAEEHLLSSRFKLEISYLKKLNNEYMFAELCDSIILTKH